MWTAEMASNLAAGARRRCRRAALLCCAAEPWCGTGRPPRRAAVPSLRASPQAERAQPATHMHSRQATLRSCLHKISLLSACRRIMAALTVRVQVQNTVIHLKLQSTHGCVADMAHALPTAHSMLAMAGPPPWTPKAAVSVGGSDSSDMRYVPVHRAAARTAAVINLRGC